MYHTPCKLTQWSKPFASPCKAGQKIDNQTQRKNHTYPAAFAHHYISICGLCDAHYLNKFLLNCDKTYTSNSQSQLPI